MKVPQLKRRDANSHKGNYGRALLIGGSRGMSGAVALAGMSASRSGAGLVTLAVPDCCLDTVAQFDPNYMTVGLPHDSDGKFTAAAIEKVLPYTEVATSIGLGPGLSQSNDIQKFVESLYQDYHGPMVVDADGLNALAKQPAAIGNAAGPRILTPHIGEFRRLIGEQLSPQACRDKAADFAATHGVVLVLKGNRTLVTDGTTHYENTTGNPGMATGGSGDVLTGVITALLGQELTAMEAAVLGVYIHGLAGDLAREVVGDVSMTATNIKDCLSEAFLQSNNAATGK